MGTPFLFLLSLLRKLGKIKRRSNPLLPGRASLFLRHVVIFLLKTICISWQIRIVLAAQLCLVPCKHIPNVPCWHGAQNAVPDEEGRVCPRSGPCVTVVPSAVPSEPSWM